MHRTLTRGVARDILCPAMSKSQQRLHGIRILHEDPDVIVIEKPAGLLVQALRHGREPSVEAILTDYVRKGQWKSRKQAYLVHRLDRETSGVMMVAKTEAVQEYFRSNWNELTEKTYLVRVEGTLPADHGVLESYLYEDADLFVRSTPDKTKGKFARTEWRVVGTDPTVAVGTDPAVAVGTDPTTLVEAILKTGRKNQIRVQFADIGHPVVGDAKYGHGPRGQTPHAKGQTPHARGQTLHGTRGQTLHGTRGQTLCLHAWKLKFVHPHTRQTLSFESPPPAYLTEKGT